MAKLVAADEIFKKLGVKERASINFAQWQPWADDEEHANDPQGFVGIFKGYKIAEKEQGGKVNEFDIMLFDSCEPVPPKGASGFAVSSGFMLDNLKYVIPGARIAIVYTGSEKNNHGGQTRNLEWSFMDPSDRKTKVATEALPASNESQFRMLAANGQA
jgi:hypothetical protein